MKIKSILTIMLATFTCSAYCSEQNSQPTIVKYGKALVDETLALNGPHSLFYRLDKILSSKLEKLRLEECRTSDTEKTTDSSGDMNAYYNYYLQSRGRRYASVRLHELSKDGSFILLGEIFKKPELKEHALALTFDFDEKEGNQSCMSCSNENFSNECDFLLSRMGFVDSSGQRKTSCITVRGS